MMLTGLVAISLDTLLLVILFLWKIFRSPGKLQSNLGFFIHLTRHSLWLLPAINSYGFANCMLSDLHVPQSSSIPLYCDSQAAMHITANLIYHEYTEHIEVDYHIVRDEYQASQICFVIVSTCSYLH